MAVHDVVLTVDAAPEVRVQAHTGVDAFNCGVIAGARNAARCAGLELGDAADLPSAKQLASPTGLPPEQRQLVEVVEYEDVAGVELGRPPQHLWVVSVRDDVALVRAVIHALRQRV